MKRLGMSARVVAQRFAYMSLISAAVALLVLSRTDSPFVERLRAVITDTAAPVLGALSHPIAAVNSAVAEFESLVDLRRENARLSRQNTRLAGWEAVSRRLEQENTALRALLGVVGEVGVKGMITARVIGDSGGPFVRTMLLDAGGRKGVRKGQAVIAGEGLVGRIVEAGTRSSRILLLTDLNSRVPVVIESSRSRAILAGDNNEQPRLIFTAGRDRPRPGDRVVTSGRGGMFAPGLPVGVVVSVEDGIPKVQPYVTWDRLEFVQVLEFGQRSPGRGAAVKRAVGAR